MRGSTRCWMSRRRRRTDSGNSCVVRLPGNDERRLVGADADLGRSRSGRVRLWDRRAGWLAQTTGAGNIPDPIPVMVLGRLATDRTWPGCRIGTALLRDAVLRVLGDAEVVGGPGDAGVRDLGGREAVLSPSRIRHRADDVVLALGDGETGVRAIVMVSMVRLRGRRRGRTMRRRTT